MHRADTRTFTFLFTDIEGSTQRWESFRDAMSAALARHDHILTVAIESRGGMVFKTVGDAFCAAFDTASDALTAALDAQRALAAEDWGAFGPNFEALRVRMAVHSGEAEGRGGDFFGPTLNRVARLLSAAHGGQILLSGATAATQDMALLGKAGMSLDSLGQHRLKDLAQSVDVFQLLAPGLPGTFPPIRSLDTHPNNLPLQSSSFVGRDRELVALAEQLDQNRIVTLVGVGGSGKTRLALQVAANLLHRFPDGAWFVDLAPISSAEQVSKAVAAVLDPLEPISVTELLGQPRHADKLPPGETERLVATRLLDRKLLVVLDNCEHVVEACARIADALARHAPHVHVLATSREPLRLPEEHLWLLSTLATPDPASIARDADPVRALGGYDAARLFIDRARSVHPNFQVTAANAPALAEICQRLDGIPLAIELAAARARILAPAEMVRRLDDRFRLLVGGSRVALPRQQTLRAMIDWSYELLTHADRLALQRLTVLAGPAPLACATAVVADMADGQAATSEGPRVSDVHNDHGEPTGLDELAALGCLDSLVEKSMLVAEEREGGNWIRLLDTIRVFAKEKQDIGDGERAQRRLLDWFLISTAGTEDVALGEALSSWIAWMTPQLPSLESSLRWASRQSGPVATLGARLSASQWWYGVDLDLNALLIEAASSAASTADMAMLRYMRSLSLAGLGRLSETIQTAQQARLEFASIGDGRHEAWALQDEGHPWQRLGNLERAEACFSGAVELKRLWSTPTDLAIALDNLGEVQRLRGALEEALAASDEAVSLIRQLDRTALHFPFPWANRAFTLLRCGHLEQCKVALSGLAATVENGEARAHPFHLVGLAGVAVAEGDGRRAVRLFGALDAEMEQLAYPLAPGVAMERDLYQEQARTLLDEADWEKFLAEGRSMTPEQVKVLLIDG